MQRNDETRHQLDLKYQALGIKTRLELGKLYDPLWKAVESEQFAGEITLDPRGVNEAIRSNPVVEQIEEIAFLYGRLDDWMMNALECYSESNPPNRVAMLVAIHILTDAADYGLLRL